jgi:hypothetical protein
MSCLLLLIFCVPQSEGRLDRLRSARCPGGHPPGTLLRDQSLRTSLASAAMPLV